MNCKEKMAHEFSASSIWEKEGRKNRPFKFQRVNATAVAVCC